MNEQEKNNNNIDENDNIFYCLKKFPIYP